MTEDRKEESAGPSPQFRTANPVPTAARAVDCWAKLRARPPAASSAPRRGPDAATLERAVSVLATLDEAPPRTRHAASIVKSSPLSSQVRAMLETRAIGRRFDAFELDLDAVDAKLPGLACPEGDVQFLASDRALEDLELSLSCLLLHKKRLLAPSIDRARPRRDVLVLGGGPGGLMTAIELALREHRVVVCEQREVYTRNRFIGVYKEIAHAMAALGMPESMTYDFTHYRGKRGIMLADIQTFLHAVALKVGVILYTGAVVRDLTSAGLSAGELELQRSTRGAGASASAIGMTRWQFDTVARVRSGVAIRFDTIVEATGGRSGLRELLVGRENVVSLREVARAAAERDPSLDSYFDDPEDHCAQFVESDYGCPPGLRKDFAAALLGDGREIPDELPCFVSNIDASVLSTPIQRSEKLAGVGARIGERELAIPPDWVVVECPLPDRRLTRYQIEGPLPRSFEFGGERVSTSACLETLNPVSLLVRILYAMGVPFDAIDRQRLVDFYAVESSHGDASDVVATWVGRFTGLRLDAKDGAHFCDRVRGAEGIEYAIVGEALQNAWYRFGVGVDDTFRAATLFAEGLDLEPSARIAAARRLERVMIARSVQILYHLFAVARNVDQGVVGPVLGEIYLDERHASDRTEARLREEVRLGSELRAATDDLRGDGADALLHAALEHVREQGVLRVLGLLGSTYDPELVRRATLSARAGTRERGVPSRTGTSTSSAPVWALLEPVLSPTHRELLAPLFRGASSPSPSPSPAAGAERLLEIAMGRYAWTSAWVRACALRALPRGTALIEGALRDAAEDREPLVAEVATAILAPDEAGLGTIDKVLILEKVSLFQSIPHEIVAGLVPLLRERRLAAGDVVFEKGELGDCLYVIASGEVRVHDGDATFRHLGERAYFGELSLLDAEPRSASVTAVRSTHLLRLAQDDLYALMRERPEILHAINRTLCSMIRSAPPAG